MNRTMDRADYLHLLHLSEQQAATNPSGYRRGLLAFASLGLAYALASIALGGALVWLAHELLSHGKLIQAALAAFGGVSIAGAALLALRVKFEPVEGFDLDPSDAPELIRLLEKMRSKLDAPAIDRIVLTDDFNAFVVQESNWGIFGRGRNTLGLGIPMLMAIDQSRLLAVLAHEYAHVRGGDSANSALLYRMRRAWEGIAQRAYANENDNDLYAALTRGFSNWYGPRFLAKAFAAGRQEEYLADRCAAKIFGAEPVAQALIEIDLLARHHADSFWPQYWQTAAHSARPSHLPLAWLAARAFKKPTASDIQSGLTEARRALPSHDDTHPTTRLRVEALKRKLEIPQPSIRHCAGLVGNGLAKAIAHWDGQWWKANRAQWELTHAALQHDLLDLQRLQQNQNNLQAADLIETALLQERLNPEQSTEPIYHFVLQKDDNNAYALWGMAQHLAKRKDPAALGQLTMIEANYKHYAFNACNTALEFIDQLPFTNELGRQRTIWKTRLERADEAEDRYNDALYGSEALAFTTTHDLKNREQRDLGLALSRMPEVLQAWVMSKNPRGEMPYRRAFLLVVDAPVSDEDWPQFARLAARRAQTPGRCVVCAWQHLSEQDRGKLGPAVYTAKSFAASLKR